MSNNAIHIDSSSMSGESLNGNISTNPEIKLNSKEKILACYKEYVSQLSNGIEDIKSVTAQNKKFENIRQTCLQNVREILEDSRKQMEQVINETVWDKLVIAFFGETNAGKSTLIETFRVKYNDPSRLLEIKKNQGKGVDGLIVGDGRQDYTQIYEKYNLQIDGRPFVLIDVPGIEGKEAKYLKEIESAVKQAHCVFYVQGHNKKPDAATAEKIKKYLSDWVDVYSIFNVRGGVSNYDEEEERESLLQPNLIETQESIKRVFEEVLPGIYKGNVTCQGYLALISVASFHESREKLISDQIKLIDYFGNRKKIESFSMFDVIAKLVQTQSLNYSSNIIKANRQKLQSLYLRIQKGIDDTINDQSKDAENLITQLQNFRNDISFICVDVITILNSKLHSELNQVCHALRSAGNDIIDDGCSVEEWRKRITTRFSNIISIFKTSISQLYVDAYSQFKSRIEEKRKDLDKVKFAEIYLPDTTFNVSINIQTSLDALKFNFKDDVLKEAIRSLNLFSIFKKTDDGRNEAKRRLSSEIDRVRSSVWHQINSNVIEVQKNITHEASSLKASIDNEIQNIEDLKLHLLKIQSTFTKMNS